MEFKAKRGFTYKGKDYFDGDKIEVEQQDVQALKAYNRIEEVQKNKPAKENKAKGLKGSSKLKRFFNK